MPACAQMKMLKPSVEPFGINQSPNPVRKRTPEIIQRMHQKHIMSMKQTEKVRRDEVVVYHVQSWMHPSCVPSAGDILRLFECIERLVSLMEYNFSELLLPMMIYAERFVQATHRLQSHELFPLLVTCMQLAMKMWLDYGPDLDLTSHVSNIPKKQISDLERAMLDKFEFRLKLSESDLDTFRTVPYYATTASH